MCSLHHRRSQFARNSISMSSLSSLNLSTPSESPSPPGIELGGSHMMLSMQYLNPRRPYKKPNFKSSNRNLGEKCSNRDHKDRDRRFSGTFIPEHHMIAMPTLATTNKVQHCNFFIQTCKAQLRFSQYYGSFNFYWTLHVCNIIMTIVIFRPLISYALHKTFKMH